MSTNLHNVLRNFNYQVEQVIPTNTIVRNRFEKYDPKQGCPSNTGGIRKFYTEYMRSNDDDGATDIAGREAEHYFRVHVEYPYCMPFDDMQMMAMQDRHDLIARLRDPQYLTGYRDAGGTVINTDIGLICRTRTGDELNKNQNKEIWRLTIEWACFIREAE